MFYRIFLYKMFASSIFIFTFATGNKNPMYPYTSVQILYGRKAHSRAAHEQIVKLAHYFYINQLKKKRL